MTKVIFKQIESCDIDFIYDDDGIRETSGKNNALYVITGNNYPVCNKSEYERISSEAENVANDFYDLANDNCSYFANYKEILAYYGIKYSPATVSKLKKYADKYRGNLDDIAAYLTITTGEAWETHTECGYCQGVYATGIYCVGHYTEEALELYVGAAAGTVSEFCRIEDDDICYGFYVPDSVTWHDDELREYMANMWGDDPDDIEIQLFDGYTTMPNYRTI